MTPEPLYLLSACNSLESVFAITLFAALHIANLLFLCKHNYPTTFGYYLPLLYLLKEILNWKNMSLFMATVEKHRGSPKVNKHDHILVGTFKVGAVGRIQFHMMGNIELAWEYALFMTTIFSTTTPTTPGPHSNSTHCHSLSNG